MEEEILEKYLPHEGDRIAVRSYALRCSESESQHPKKKKEHDMKTSQDKKMALIEKVSQSMKFGSQNTIESEGASSTASCSRPSVFCVAGGHVQISILYSLFITLSMPGPNPPGPPLIKICLSE